MGQFGSPKGAVGAAIGVNRLLSVLSGVRKSRREAAFLVYAEKTAEDMGYKVARSLRAKGRRAEMYIGDDRADAEEYAKARGADALFCVSADGGLVIKNQSDGDEESTTVNAFLETR